MSLFSTADINRFVLQAEEDFAEQHKCILMRYTPNIFSGTAQYTLPDNIISIIQVTWKGWRLDPMSQRELRDSLLSGTQGGRPFQYIYNNIGQSVIRFFPIPQEAIGAITGDTLYNTRIETHCIIEYWRTPDGSTYTIPAYIRRRLLKAGAMKELYAMEGKGQNLKAVKYWTAMWEKLSEDYSNLLNDLHNKPRNLNNAGDLNNFYKVPPPRLPIARYGVGVDY